MRVTILACVMMAASAAQAAGPTEPVQVTLWERVWTVAPIKERPGSYSAIRDAGDNNPFGRPAIRKSVQAKRAIDPATIPTIRPRMRTRREGEGGYEESLEVIGYGGRLRD